ncbi:MAG: NADH-quinone oxidoreductase subunit N [Vicinamibacteria bacterium]
MSPGPLDLRPILPALIVTVTALVVLLAQAFTPRGKRAPAVPICLFGLAAAGVAVLLLAPTVANGASAVLGGTLVADAYALFLEALIIGVGFVAVLLSSSYLRETQEERGEYYALTLFSLVGMLGLVSATELIAVFVALEIMSVALYALTGFDRRRPESQEAAIKYFVTGAFSSAFFLYGVAFLYGVSGSTSLDRIAQALASPDPGSRGMALLGVGLLLVGFGFKVASVPFHMWAPDVYEGAPTTVTGFMAAGVKAAAFGALMRVLGMGLLPLSSHWQPAIAVLALLTMVIGNLGALAQGNVKRMLAYSSVAHAGYLLTAAVAAPRLGAAAILFYLMGYAAVNLGAFGAIAALTREGREPLSLGDMAGLASRRPALAAAITVFLVSLAGVPVSAGFVGKFYLFAAAVNAGYTGLAIVGVLMSVVSAYYYLRVVVAMYMRDPVGDDNWAEVAAESRIALAIAVVVVLGLGVFPGTVLTLARRAAESLL